MKKSIKISIRILSFAILCCLTLSAVFAPQSGQDVVAVGDAIRSAITKVSLPIENDISEFFDGNVVYQLPATVASDDEISVIVKMNVDSVMDGYDRTDKNLSVSEYAATKDAADIAEEVKNESDALMSVIDKSGVDYVLGERYDTILSGFEVTVKAFDFAKLGAAVGDRATLIVGEQYNKCETEVVTNFVEVYETGIFDSSDSVYQGDGVVVAVLDTGLDYTHTAFSVDNFTTNDERFTLSNVSDMVGGTAASRFTRGLTGEDVYVSKKVPYAYDYADKDPDVLPINSEHGTHVAGVIAGKDSEITGVAPNAQLAIFKVFSDIAEGAKTSWLLAALEDCVVLGVDVINMSLGSSCGFSREIDGEATTEIYDRIGEAGISLICAASNSYTATFSSKKNGTNSLTTNPDSGTVGSPSTYMSALSVASVDGVMTPYLMYGDQIMYFNEASTSSAKTKDFVDDLLKTLYEGGYTNNPDYAEVEYVTVAGIGRSADYFYDKEYYQGKIALVKRGQTTFEEKIRIALKEKGAAGVIIYNNISGVISMSVGADIGAACSISQDDGEMLAAHDTGKLIVSRGNVAGPFMSDFSSWGPTSDLKIKPEITAHGGEIYSAVPGQAYDRLSGTSMACPNEAGAAALIRQYVKSGKFGENISPVEVTAIVNRLMMSTADIILNKNGLPYAVRKQGAGLVNIKHSYQTAAYVTTYDTETGKALDKSKLELGDDKQKTGVYQMTFDVVNISNNAVSYDVDSIVLTEGVSKTYTGHSDTTVSQDGYLLGGAKTTVSAVVGGTQNGNTITVAAGKTAKVTLKIALSDEDKEYLDKSFRYGMYVEGFVTFDAKSGTEIDMNVPLLAFYGDWTEAPIFDEEYYDTNVDELNQGLDDDDKLMADAYATRVIGGIYSDYISTLGSYYFVQDPSATQIAADKEHIAISNQATGESGSTINSIRSIWAGLLRNVKEYNISIVEDATGKEIYSLTDYNQRKSSSSGGDVRMSSIDVEFSALEHNLKNNTRYTVTVTTYIDYGAKEDQKNVRNTFTFPLYIDFQAPVVTGVAYRTEYDRTSKKTSLFADISVYDNHYAMALQLGQIIPAEEGSEYTYTMNTFGKYITPVFSSYNSTATVTVDLTDYVSLIKNSIGPKFDENGNSSGPVQTNSFIISCYDYAMNRATYQVQLPDEILSMYFTEDEIRLSPNETLRVSDVLNIYPAESWMEVLDYKSSASDVADVVNGTILAKTSGTAIITAIGHDSNGNTVTADVTVKVLAAGEEGYDGTYSVPEVSKFTVTGYQTLKAFYKVSSDDRDIGVTDGVYEFGNDYSLSMFPSEKVRLQYSLDTYYADRTTVEYRVGNSKVATVDGNGVILAVSEGSTIVSVRVLFDGKSAFSRNVHVTVKDPFVTQSIYLMSYNGDGDENHVVDVPADRGITTIYSFAFTGYEYVEKDVNNGDVIDEEDPYYIKQWYIGEDSIKKIILPEGVTDIQSYAFTNLSALEEVVLPSTLVRIGLSAFEGCTNLKKINLENVKFVNERAFYNCGLEEIDLSSVVSIGNYTFAGNKLTYIELPKSSQSLGVGAFYNNKYLASVQFDASKIKLGAYAFAECSALSSIRINAAVISASAFRNCSALSEVTLGKDVSVIGEYAFAGTDVSAFRLAANNDSLTLKAGGALVYKGTELVLCAPLYSGAANNVTLTDATSIARGAFSGNTRIRRVTANKVTTLGAYAFADCSNLATVNMGALESIGDYAFYRSGLNSTPALDNVTEIGSYAFFYNQNLTSVAIPEGCSVGNYAFANCPAVTAVTIGDNAVIGDNAFYCVMALNDYDNTSSFNNYTQYTYNVYDENGNVVDSYTYLRYNFLSGVFSRLASLNVGEGVTLGNYAFFGNGRLAEATLGANTVIGNYAFFNCGSLAEVDLSSVASVGAYAFSGTRTRQFMRTELGLDYAYERAYISGNVYTMGYAYSSFAPAMTSVDLTLVGSIGEGAFANNPALTNVELNENITEIAPATFANTSVNSITLPENVTSIGDYAFFGTALTAIDLSHVAVIGEYAFANADLAKVSLAAGAVIGERAFSDDMLLSVVEGLDEATYIGNYAFYRCSLAIADLGGAQYIGDFAFGLNNITSVTFGSDLAALGENPFFACPIETYGKYEDVVFNGKTVDRTLNEDYDISDTVSVKAGVLYQMTENGLELVSYPMLKEQGEYVVEEGTVRIADSAFAGSGLNTVMLPLSLVTIGDKAFYACEELETVVFQSLAAPRLEETYDESYANYENIAYTGKIALMNGITFDGLGIIQYYMWNYTTLDCSYFFGANFVDYIGHIDEKITMVKPTNGDGYDNFIFAQYFDTKIKGAASPSQATLDTIALIDEIPSYVTLSDEDKVIAARAAYDSISSNEQKALVNNYDVLVVAEQTIEYLRSREQTSSDSSSASESASESQQASEDSAVSSVDVTPSMSSTETSVQPAISDSTDGCNGAIGIGGALLGTVAAILAAVFAVKRKETV